jgi:UDP-N-acetylmuramyl pentapeptide phosphotransferase/UDP-N-acetylglucosamine-1-phosphate transferase
MKNFVAAIFAFTLFVMFAPPARAQAESERLQQIEARLETVERETTHRVRDGMGVVAFLFGAFCALWAQNTGRNAWLWFFLGFLFHVVTIFVLLYKNSQRTQRADSGPS